MNVLDRVILLMLATLMLAVVFVERRKLVGVPAHVQPPAPGNWLLERSNVPCYRGLEAAVVDVGFIDVDDAADAGNEP